MSKNRKKEEKKPHKNINWLEGKQEKKNLKQDKSRSIPNFKEKPSISITTRKTVMRGMVQNVKERQKRKLFFYDIVAAKEI